MDEHGTGSGKEVSISQYDSESLDKEKRRAILRAEIKHDLETNPRYKELFDQYSPYSVQSFIDHYVWKKESCLTLGDFFLRDESDNLLRFETEGAELMWQIQHKKLFDLECLWRAEQIKIAEVEQTWDFRYWEDHLERCPFLPPITEDEIDTYVDYLMSDLYEEESMRKSSLRRKRSTNMPAL